MKKLEGEPSSWAEKLKEAEDSYNYQPELTKKLDAVKGDFTENTLLKIVLWKTNRFPEIDQELLDSINDLRASYNEKKAKEVLLLLLNKRGIALPMASTILRFALPRHFQIIDQRSL